ncbi:hypothetical protein BO83DRAFT_128508 [Aspergillus eucalypticola CBS 122712]|uniref:Cytochrome P450 n=1 Tax=Aspergillus eucalypticola (strain CBS 122712 / IBT 29274) TaxID=1448314 RepID=A0A317W8P2_ASPEC|nr:uncharacterized protein BO83DRAFT_128508 [Aspergillus eucalypticola CBS 122712]PWY82275.1 hypothetical protein BO83DRAFT_128508 [Aspergillus eucalypticola CBS 122712]
MRVFEPKLLPDVHRFRDTLYLAQTDADGREPPMIMSDWCSYFAFGVIIDLGFRRLAICSAASSPNVRCTLYYILRYHRLGNSMMADAASMSICVFSRLTKARRCCSVSCFGRCHTQIRIPLPSAYARVFYLATTSCIRETGVRNTERISHGSDIRSSPLMQQCTYIQTCNKAKLRISPAVAACPYRRVEEDNKIIVDGCVIPAGCSVGTGIYSIHSLLDCPRQIRTPQNDGCPKQSQRHINLGVNSAAYVPFSQGTRACIGRHLAQLELQMTLASIMWRATTCDGQPRPPQ